ncbi:uncharacterized protein LOC119573417 [Penaeus monodon]|uniref:uncharacterized protein LOC119573417 n=1 Tax=Penaeus monodon TaxID=6687 RepID=UPI0018A78959|nr:uncharacterized protein LOC119573417 [Penaeus monodon]
MLGHAHALRTRATPRLIYVKVNEEYHVSSSLVVTVLADQSSQICIIFGGASAHEYEPAVPKCAASITKPLCLHDDLYPTCEIKHTVEPLRAQNTEGKWRVAVNNIDTHYQTLIHTTRIKECLTSADACHLVPDSYESKCLQKSIYHHFSWLSTPSIINHQTPDLMPH